MQFVEQSMSAAWRGRRGIVWPILIGAMRGVLRLSLFYAAFALVITAFRIEFSSKFALGTGICTFLILFFFLLAWWIFSASCRIMWLHDLASGNEKHPKNRIPFYDLPVMLGIDAAFGAIKWINIGAVLLGIAGLVMNTSELSMLAIAFGGVMAIVCSILEPAVTAQRVVDGPGFLRAVRRATSRILQNSARALCIRFLPAMMRVSCFAAAGWEGLTGHGMLMLILAAAGAAISLIEPVFWTEFAQFEDDDAHNA